MPVFAEMERKNPDMPRKIKKFVEKSRIDPHEILRK
jgi:hypothetical protein